MLIALPILTVSIVFLNLLGLQKVRSSSLTGCRVALLQSVLMAGVFITLQSEFLSLFHLLTRVYVVALWLLGLLISVWFGLRRGLLTHGWKKLKASLCSMDRITVVTLVAFILIFLLLLVIVVIAPANNLDSLLYHMSRVMHWAQDRSLAHYPVGFEVQLTHPIFAELSILQLRLLWGNDQLASLPQWLSLILCAITVSLGARLLGAKRKGQLAAAAFAISIPIGLLEATSTQNDYVTALWLVILAVFVLFACQEEPSHLEILSMAAALGLGLLTKGTFYPYAVAWGLWLIIHWLKQRKPLIFLKRSLVIITVVVLLNAGYWTRNLITYGGPLGPTQWVADMSSARFGVGSVASNLVKDILLNLTTPSPRINQIMVSFIQSTFKTSDPDVGNFKLDWRWNNEDSAGSPLHLLLILVSAAGVLVWLVTGRLKAYDMLWYSLAAFFSFIIFVLAAHYDDYGVRFQLPLFIVWSPVFGVLISRLSEKWLAPIMIFSLFIISLPYVFFNTTRPLIAMKNDPEPYAIHPLPAMGTTKSSNIFFADQRALLFINAPDMDSPLMEATHDIKNMGCTQVGLRIDSHDVEYPIWWLLQAPQSGIRIESLYYSNLLSRYADPDFKPCAIICTICNGRIRLNGLELFGSYDSVVKLFVGDSYSIDADK
jgi:Dolichyl-phosphate-mannose-protein mannosyltransferase